MKKIVFIYLITIMSCVAQAPEIQWQKSFGGSNDENAVSVIQTPDGGYIFTGRANSYNGDVTGYQWNYDFFNGDVWIVKTDNAGNIEWQKLYGGYANDGGLKIISTTDGGYIVAAASESSNGTVASPLGGYDYWILKLDGEGNLLWQRRLGGSGADFVRDIAQTTDGGYIVFGNSNSNVFNTHGLIEAYLVKLAPNGTTQWTKPIGGTGDDYGYAVIQTADGGYMITGKTNSADGNFTVNQGDFDAFVVKTDSAGTVQWQKTYGGTNDDYGLGITSLDDGTFVMAGSTLSNDGDVSQNLGFYDLWVVKIDQEGTIIWEQSVGGSYSESYSSAQIIRTSDGGFITCGDTNSGNGDATGNHGSNIQDVWIVKFDIDGNKQWHRCFGGGAEDYGYSVIQTSDNGYMISALNRTNISNPNSPDWTPNHGSYDAWLIKLNAENLNTKKNERENLMILPNPVKGVLHIQNIRNKTITRVIVNDLLGKNIMNKAGNTTQIDLNGLSAGIYILSVFSEDEVYQMKFIKE